MSKFSSIAKDIIILNTAQLKGKWIIQGIEKVYIDKNGKLHKEPAASKIASLERKS